MDRAKVQLTMPADIEAVLAWATSSDLNAFRRGFDMTPELALREFLYSGRRMFTGFINGDPVCIFGAYQKTVMDPDLYVWMLGTTRLRRHPVFFMKHCAPVFEQLVQGHDQIFAIVDPENQQATKWMNRLGFSRVDSLKLNGQNVFPLMKLTERKWLS